MGAMSDLIPQTLTVAEFNQLIDQVLRQLGSFSVRGEITEFRVTGRKGVFITLKDPAAEANLSVSGYAPSIKGIDLVEAGMEVVVTGVGNFYSPYGKFSLQATAIEPFGEGALRIAYEKLKNKLTAEGLFDVARKKPVPPYFGRIALITAAGSAAYGDFTKVLKEHACQAEIDFYPVTVQGKNALPEIDAAMRLVAPASYDAVVLIRGGGSLEDLIAFNEEELVRRVAGSKHFTIVGVGHERDESLCDYAADLRASTPTQAATYLYQQNDAFIALLTEQVDGIADRVTERLNILADRITLGCDTLETSLDRQLDQRAGLLEKAGRRLEKSFDRYDRTFVAFDHLGELLKSYSPADVLRRGYACVRGAGGSVVSSVSGLKSGAAVEVQMKDGSFSSVIGAVRHDG
jgi:exodeoxyribonuclease VII large subunit